MNAVPNNEAYTLIKMEDGTYEATSFSFGMSCDIVIPEEYNGTPITKITVTGHFSGMGHFGYKIHVSKNVKIFMYPDFMSHDTMSFLVELSPENPWLCTDGKAVFSKDKTILYAYTAPNEKSYTIPDEVRVIYRNAFQLINSSFSGLEELNFPDELDEIQDMAFYHINTKKLRLPKRVKKIGSLAFASILNTTNFILPETIEQMAPDAFDDTECSSAVYIPDFYNKPEYGIPNYSLAPVYTIDKDSKTLTIVDGVVYTKDMKALLSFTGQAPEMVTVSDGVEVIGSQADAWGAKTLEVILPKSVHTILRNAFYHSALKKINLENVKIIEESAFKACIFLTDTGKIGAQIIGSNAFDFCASLGIVHLTNIREIHDGAFEDLKTGAEIFLPEGLEKIHGKKALESSFKSIRIPRSASKSLECFPWKPSVIELYDVEDSAVYQQDPMINNFYNNCLVKVLSPDTDNVKYAVKILDVEVTAEVKNTTDYINSLFGGEQFFDLKKYDEYFQTVFSNEWLPSKYEAAYYRIKYPEGLTDEARRMYTSYLELYAADIVREMLKNPNITAEIIAEFPYLYSILENDLLDLIKLSAELRLIEITAFLINYKNERFNKKDDA